MTLPIERILPPVPTLDSLDTAQKYIQNLRVELEDMYQEMTQNINGFFRNNDDVDGSEWKPTIRGSTTTGSPTYASQTGFVLRQGIMTDIFFSVGWTSLGGAAGNLFLDLPYKIIPTSTAGARPFFGPASSGGVTSATPTGPTYPAGRTSLNVVGFPGTYLAKFEASGSGVNSAPINVRSNSYVGGHLRFIGVEDE